MPSPQLEVCSADVVRLMADLNDWQKLVVQFECVLTWEKPLVLFYIILVVTAFHALLWAFEPPFLVSVGYLSLSFSLWCYFGPRLAIRFLPSVPITERNQRYRAFCRRILDGRQLFILVYRHISDLRQRRPYIYTIICLCTILNMEILTYYYDGILISYMLTIIFLLTPGIRHTGLLMIIYLLVKKSFHFVWRIISRAVSCLWISSSHRSD
ncbi:unnamed protein product [Rodentolepis nana]|uniref:Pecanex-like protein n=1 Tax=Rodentolepis nana TaxID=102285 RepID=A0A0R3T5L3_RODNA|nr:unnamed protein product [Rodentolepis nana]